MAEALLRRVFSLRTYCFRVLKIQLAVLVGAPAFMRGKQRFSVAGGVASYRPALAAGFRLEVWRRWIDFGFQSR